MCKRLFGILIVITFLSFTTTTHAASDDVLDGMAKKLKRGVINTFTGWMEFPIQIGKGFNEGFRGDEDNKLLGVIFGVFDGVGHSLGRTLSGVTEVAGFWAANPKDNKNIGIPLDAEYAWEDGKPYDIFDPNFTDATLTPTVNKLFRGVSNTLLGFMELPNQIGKGISEKSPHFSIVKGLWYWLSREISGISDIVTVPFANPEDTVGVSFDEEPPRETPAEEAE